MRTPTTRLENLYANGCLHTVKEKWNERRSGQQQRGVKRSKTSKQTIQQNRDSYKEKKYNRLAIRDVVIDDRKIILYIKLTGICNNINLVALYIVYIKMERTRAQKRMT